MSPLTTPHLLINLILIILKDFYFIFFFTNFLEKKIYSYIIYKFLFKFFLKNNFYQYFKRLISINASFMGERLNFWEYIATSIANVEFVTNA